MKAKEVTWNGVTYPSMRQAKEETGVNIHYWASKGCKSDEDVRRLQANADNGDRSPVTKDEVSWLKEHYPNTFGNVPVAEYETRNALTELTPCKKAWVGRCVARAKKALGKADTDGQS